MTDKEIQEVADSIVILTVEEYLKCNGFKNLMEVIKKDD
jgi:hypothetical protein